MPETNIVTTNTSIDDIRNFMNFVFHDKSPGASVFACMGGTDAGVLFRSTMGMGKKLQIYGCQVQIKMGDPIH